MLTKSTLFFQQDNSFKQKDLKPQFNKSVPYLIHSKSTSTKENLQFNNLTIQTIDGKEILLKELWKDKTVIIKILPRLGCALCKREAQALSQVQPLFEKHNVKMVAIAFEDIDLASFLSSGYWRWDIYLDPERKVYKAAGLTKMSIFNFLKCILNKYLLQLVFGLQKQGYENNNTGDRLQLGGTFVIDSKGNLLYEFRPSKLAYFPSIKEIYQLIGGDPSEIDEEINQRYIFTRKRLSDSGSASSVPFSFNSFNELKD